MECPICQSGNTTAFLERSGVPVHQNLLCASREAARTVNRGDLSLVMCGDCGFTFNRSFDEGLLSYGELYDSTQTCSPAFEKYVDDLVAHLVEERGVVNKTIVEIGCGKGYFLDKLCARAGNRGIGFDPSYLGPESKLDGRLSFVRSFYGPENSDTPADVVVCRHVIEHTQKPMTLLGAVHGALAASGQANVYFETPNLDWILENMVMWDFFFEHCSYFTKDTLKYAFELAGFRAEEVREVFGGQYLVYEGRVIAVPEGRKPQTGGTLLEKARRYAASEKTQLKRWRKRLEEHASEGRIAIWGAGAKGVTLANLADPDCELIDCVIDLNPAKQGKYTPGTGHPIYPFESLGERRVDVAILMNPNYREENQLLLDGARIKTRLIE